jgi:hypothetical protein
MSPVIHKSPLMRTTAFGSTKRSLDSNGDLLGEGQELFIGKF